MNFKDSKSQEAALKSVWGRGAPYADKHSHSGTSLREITEN